MLMKLKVTKDNLCPRCDSSNVFSTTLIIVYIIAGVLHPQEMHILASGMVYFISLPTTFVLLNIYSFCNLHVMKWGTREGPKKKEEIEAERELKEKKKKTWCLSGLNIQINIGGNDQRNESVPVQYMPQTSLPRESHLHPMGYPSYHENNNFQPGTPSHQGTNSYIPPYPNAMPYAGAGHPTVIPQNVHPLYHQQQQQINQKCYNYVLGHQQEINSQIGNNTVTTTTKPRKTLDITYEKYDLGKHMKNLPRQILDKREIKFYKDLIRDHLKPLFENQETKVKIEKGLIKLRNSFCVLFFGLNIAWMILAFTVSKLDAGYHFQYPKFLSDYCGNLGQQNYNSKNYTEQVKLYNFNGRKMESKLILDQEDSSNRTRRSPQEDYSTDYTEIDVSSIDVSSSDSFAELPGFSNSTKSKANEPPKIYWHPVERCEKLSVKIWFLLLIFV